LASRFGVLDICTEESENSMCFTKAYSRYLEGTGSVFTRHSKVDLENSLKKIQISMDPEEIMDLKKSLELRFFSPQEVARLMCFPDKFSFPKNVTEKQKYRLLGNSINVKVVSHLIKLMVER
jgi:tRNA (cytosine38-C5)-methyltransferase